MIKRILSGHRGPITCLDFSAKAGLTRDAIAIDTAGDGSGASSSSSSSSSSSLASESVFQSVDDSSSSSSFQPEDKTSKGACLEASSTTSQERCASDDSKDVKKVGSSPASTEFQLASFYGLLASGSEDKTVRLWDLRTNEGAITCITGVGSAIESVQFNPVDSNVIYAISNRSIFTFDIRMNSPSLIIREARSSLLLSSGAKAAEEDEINCMSVHHRGHCLFSSHDSGDISIVPLDTSTFDPVTQLSSGFKMKKASGGHTALVSTLQSRPRNSWEFASGGFDYKVCLWDINKGRSIKTKTFASPNAFNPPFVQGLSFHNSGKYLFAGLGSGSVAVLSCPDLGELATMEAHRGMVSSLSAIDDYVVTAGVDRKIQISKMNFNGSSSSSKSKSKGGKSKSNDKSEPLPNSLSPVFHINHGQKINAMHSLWTGANLDMVSQKLDSDTSSATNPELSTEELELTSSSSSSSSSLAAGNIFSNSPLVVGDITNNITLYYFKS